MSYVENPKTKSSGIICCAPQTTACSRGCADCFAQRDGVYAELPNVPDYDDTKGRVVRIGDISDAYHQLDKTLQCASLYDDAFLNTSYDALFDKVHDMPIVLTVNPGEMTDKTFYRLEHLPGNLMFVRVRVNAWNLKLVDDIVSYYTSGQVDGTVIPVILTFMAYYETPIMHGYRYKYEWQKRTLNSYWCLKLRYLHEIEARYADNDLVYSCGKKCVRCGNCIREFFATKERLRDKECI